MEVARNILDSRDSSLNCNGDGGLHLKFLGYWRHILNLCGWRYHVNLCGFSVTFPFQVVLDA